MAPNPRKLFVRTSKFPERNTNYFRDTEDTGMSLVTWEGVKAMSEEHMEARLSRVLEKPFIIADVPEEILQRIAKQHAISENSRIQRMKQVQIFACMGIMVYRNMIEFYLVPMTKSTYDPNINKARHIRCTMTKIIEIEDYEVFIPNFSADVRAVHFKCNGNDANVVLMIIHKELMKQLGMYNPHHPILRKYAIQALL